MLHYLLRRLLQFALTLIAISFLVFAAMFVIGDPVATLLPPTATTRARAELSATLGLDQPLITQYARWLGRLARGDMGTSYYSGEPVARELARRAPATFELAGVSLLLTVLVGIPLGILAAARRRNWLARVAMKLSLLGISLPSFWLGLCLLMLFGVALNWLPSAGRGPTRELFGTRWSFLSLEGLRHLILPAATLAAYNIALVMRLTRSEMRRVLRQPFIAAARARGLGEGSIVCRHALRNALVPIVTILGMQLGEMLAFSVVTETVFQWPGLGKLLIDRIYVDRPLVVAYLTAACVIYLALNFLIDLSYAAIDPRIRHAEERRI